MKEKIKEKIVYFLPLLFMIVFLILLTGCSDAYTVSKNISKEAGQFNVLRRIVFVNLRTDTYLFEVVGFCDIENGTYNELEVICQTGEDDYQKHFFYIAEETTYTVEQLDDSNVSKYSYEIIFRPEAITNPFDVVVE